MNQSDQSGHQITFVYDTVLPCSYAAPIQILNTAAALAAAGVRTRVVFHAIRDGAAAALREYAIQPHAELELLEHPCRTANQCRRLLRSLHQNSSHSKWTLIVRGESGVRIINVAARLAPPNLRVVLEMHRLCDSDWQERSGWLVANWRRRWIRRREGAAIRRADGLIFLTEGVRGAVADRVQIHQASVIAPSGCDVPTAQDLDTEFAKRDIDLIYAGKLDERKGVLDLIAMMTHMPDRTLVLCGGTDEQCKRLGRIAADRGVGDQVEFKGWLAPRQTRGLVRRARVGFCPLPTGVSEISDRLTSPLKVLELLSAGTPIVATRTGPIETILTDGRDALLVPANSPEALAAAALKILQNDDLAMKLSSAGREVAKRHSWPVRAALLLGLAQRLHEPGPR